MIPNEIIKSFEENNIPYKRNESDKESALKILEQLGLSNSSEAYEYYSQIYGGNTINPRAIDEMLDIADEDIFDTLDYVQERYEISSDFIPLTSDQAEGMFLLNIKDNKVYDFELADYKDFIDDPKPRWDSFYSFLLWYINPELK